MLTGIVLFEWRYHTRRVTFAAAVAFFTLMGFMLAATGFRSPGVWVNAPYTVAHSVGLLSLMTVFILTLFCAQSLLRDSEHRMAEIVYTTSVTKGQYLLGRFAGSYLAASTTFATALVGMVLGTFLVAHDPADVGPFDALDYLWHFAVLAVPNMLFAGALLFAVAALTRSAMATYVGGVLLYMLYFAVSLFTNSPLMAQSSPPTPEGLAVAALADPFGLAAFFEQTHYLTAVERNARRLALSGHFLLNRLVWTGVSVLVLGFAYRVFAFRLPRGAKGEATEAAEADADVPGYRPTPAEAGRPAAQWRALWSATKLELRYALKSWPFVVLLVSWVCFVAMDLFESLRSTEFHTALLPTTGLLIGRVQEPLALFGLLVIVYYSADLAWRERAARMDEIVDASPASNAVLLASKAAALALLVAVLAAAAVAVAVAFQLAAGYAAPQLGLYASILYFTGLPLVLVAVLALFLQTIAPNRWVGMLATVAAFIVLHKGAGGPDHPLLRYAAAPRVPYSDMNGFSPAAVSFGWFMLYWTAFAGLLALVTCRVWRRGTDARLLPRLTALPRGWSRAARFALVACALLFATTGAAVFYQTNVVDSYETREDVYDFKAGYERAYRHLEGVAQPSVAHVEANVDLYPEDRRFEVRGRYLLENRTDEPVDTVWVALRRDLTSAGLSLAGSPPTYRDERFGMVSFALDRPLAPGATAELDFDVTVERGGAQAGGTDHDVVENGSFLLSVFTLPTLGYRFTYELRDPAERRRRGLPESARPATIEDARSGAFPRLDLDRVTFETTVSTAADQIAVAPGALEDSWQEGGRSYYRYTVERPVMAHFAWVSARYAVERVRHGGVDVEVYYHPGHGVNVERFVDGATRSLDYCVTHFGPYPYPQLRIVEIPAYWEGFAGLALPGVLYFVEDHGFLTDLGAAGRVDVVTKRVAHEVAHQWWGHQLSPAQEPGASALVETLARYTELMVLKGRYGEAALPQVLSIELDRYLAGRTGGGEVPLYQVHDQPWLFYSKGAIVMMAVHDLVGEEAVNRALARLLAASAESDDPPTSLDLLDRLYDVTPEEHQTLLDQWWKDVVLYDLRIDSATYEALPDGRYRVTARLEAAKGAVRGGGEEPLAMDEALDFAVYSKHPNAASGPDALIYEGSHRVVGATELTVVVDERPEYVAVDPFVRRIERDRVDNVRKVEKWIPPDGRRGLPRPETGRSGR